jgi:hypothetical protein
MEQPSGSFSQSVGVTTTNTPAHFLTTASSAPSTRQASVDVLDNDENNFWHNAGTPKNPDTILESVKDDDNDFTPLVTKKDQHVKKKTAEIVKGGSEMESSKKETDEEELGMLN